jgi:hypothetical protein
MALPPVARCDLAAAGRGARADPGAGASEKDVNLAFSSPMHSSKDKHIGSAVRRTPCRPRSWANFSLLQLYPSYGTVTHGPTSAFYSLPPQECMGQLQPFTAAAVSPQLGCMGQLASFGPTYIHLSHLRFAYLGPTY